jgi:hypothetical protein
VGWVYATAGFHLGRREIGAVGEVEIFWVFQVGLGVVRGLGLGCVFLLVVV